MKRQIYYIFTKINTQDIYISTHIYNINSILATCVTQGNFLLVEGVKRAIIFQFNDDHISLCYKASESTLNKVTLSRRGTHYCVVEDINTLNISLVLRK